MTHSMYNFPLCDAKSGVEWSSSLEYLIVSGIRIYIPSSEYVSSVYRTTRRTRILSITPSRLLRGRESGGTDRSWRPLSSSFLNGVLTGP